MTTRESFGLDVKEALKGADAYEEIMAAFDDVTLEKGVMPKDTPNTEQTPFEAILAVLKGYEPMKNGKGEPLGYDLDKDGRTEFGFYWEYEDMEDCAKKLAIMMRQATERAELAGRRKEEHHWIDRCSRDIKALHGDEDFYQVQSIKALRKQHQERLAELQKEKDNK